MLNIALELKDMGSRVHQAESFGAALFEARKSKGFTQDQLSDRCGNLVTASYISLLETGKKYDNGNLVRASETVIDALADALGESRNRFRDLAGYAPTKEEAGRDEITEEFSFMLARYKQLTERGRDFVKQQVAAMIEFVGEFESTGKRLPAGKIPLNDAFDRMQKKSGPK